jgi:hypothetical protein
MHKLEKKSTIKENFDKKDEKIKKDLIKVEESKL